MRYAIRDTPVVAIHEREPGVGSAARPIPVYAIMLMDKNDSKPKNNRFYQC